MVRFRSFSDEELGNGPRRPLRSRIFDIHEKLDGKPVPTAKFGFRY
jgi:hypothetical protein